jgi:hypothetical protein
MRRSIDGRAQPAGAPEPALGRIALKLEQVFANNIFERPLVRLSKNERRGAAVSQYFVCSICGRPPSIAGCHISFVEISLKGVTRRRLCKFFTVGVSILPRTSPGRTVDDERGSREGNISLIDLAFGRRRSRVPIFRLSKFH